MGTVLEAEGLLVGYAGAPVCGEVSASVDAGEVLGIVGVNGAGKSTVARTIAGRQASLSGDVKVHGLLIDPDAVPFRRQVSAVFDDDLFFPSLTVREHLLLIARGHSLDDPEARVEEEPEFFGSRGTTPPRCLDLPATPQVALAAGLIRPSSLLILDSRNSGLIPGARPAKPIADHAKDGGAVVLVTHDPQLLLATASPCLVIDEEVRSSIRSTRPRSLRVLITLALERSPRIGSWPLRLSDSPGGPPDATTQPNLVGRRRRRCLQLGTRYWCGTDYCGLVRPGVAQRNRGPGINGQQHHPGTMARPAGIPAVDIHHFHGPPRHRQPCTEAWTDDRQRRREHLVADASR